MDVHNSVHDNDIDYIKQDNNMRGFFISSMQKEFRDEHRSILEYIHSDPLLKQFFHAFLFEDLPTAAAPPDEFPHTRTRQRHLKIVLHYWCENVPKTMKKTAIPLMAIVVFWILIAGCIQPAGTGPVTTPVPVPSPPPDGAVTVAVTTQHTMNETLAVPSVQTPATILPVSNGTIENESINKENNRNTPLSVKNTTTGGLFINIQRGGSVDGLKVFIAREGTDLSQIEYTFLPDRTVVEGENKGYLQVNVPADGHSELIRLPPGNYTAYIPTMGGGEMEQQSFGIREEVVITIYFMGFSAAGGGGCGC